MTIQRIIQAILLISAFPALAFPVANLKNVAKKREQANCQRRSPNSDFRDLIVKASYMDEDDRKPLSQNWEILGFNEAEVEQAMRCTGHIFCPGGNNGKGAMQSTGAICPPGHRDANGKCAADRLGTSGHMFINKKTNRYISKLDQCEFQNYMGHKSLLVVGDLKTIDPKYDHLNPKKNIRNDKVAIRLKTPIPGCDPYDLDESSEPPRDGEMLTAVTYPHIDQDEELFPGNEPLAYNCQSTKGFRPKGGGPALFYNNCDVNKIGSGGLALKRRSSDSKLVVKGFFIKAAEVANNGQPYSVENGNFTIAIGTGADFVKLAQNPGVVPEPQITQTEVTTTLQPASN